MENKEQKKFVITENEAVLLHDAAIENEDVQLAMRVNRGNVILKVVENIREGLKKESNDE